MKAEWNAVAISTMSAEENLRNTCKQLEQQYVDWRRAATCRGCCISRQWPAIGELGRWQVEGVVNEFVTTRRRSILVKDATGTVRSEVPMRAGMAEQLFEIAATIARNFLASAHVPGPRENVHGVT